MLSLLKSPSLCTVQGRGPGGGGGPVGGGGCHGASIHASMMQHSSSPRTSIAAGVMRVCHCDWSLELIPECGDLDINFF
jgi:hypothetical protein